MSVEVVSDIIDNEGQHFAAIKINVKEFRPSNLDQWERLLAGFCQYRSVTSISLGGGDSLIGDDKKKIFSTLRNLPNLSKVKLTGFSTFDLEETKWLFDNNDTIEKLLIDDCMGSTSSSAEYNEDKCNGFEVFLGYLSSMSKNRLRHLDVSIGIPCLFVYSAGFASLLSESSKLETITMKETKIRYRLPPQSVEDQRENFANAMAALHSNSSLKTLDMNFLISYADFKHVASMLKYNQCLAELCVNLGSKSWVPFPENSHSRPDYLESMQLFIEALRTNTKSVLSKAFEYGGRSRCHRHARAFAREMDNPQNRTKYPSEIKNLIDMGLEMLRINVTLEIFDFFLLNHEARWEVNARKLCLYLRLNKQGRRLVQRRDISDPVPKSVWVDQLSKHSRDLDALFYYISANPSLCQEVLGDSACSMLKPRCNTDKRPNREETANGKRGHVEEAALRDRKSSQNENQNEAIDNLETKRQRCD